MLDGLDSEGQTFPKWEGKMATAATNSGCREVGTFRAVDSRVEIASVYAVHSSYLQNLDSKT